MPTMTGVNFNLTLSHLGDLIHSQAGGGGGEIVPASSYLEFLEFGRNARQPLTKGIRQRLHPGSCTDCKIELLFFNNVGFYSVCLVSILRIYWLPTHANNDWR